MSPRITVLERAIWALACARRVGDDAVGTAAEGDQVREHRLEDGVVVAARCVGWGGRSDDAGCEAAYEPARRGVGRRNLWRTERVVRRIELWDSNASGLWVPKTRPDR
jgi:hypothetical protein